jgi:predicted RNase H-like nuclease (RuvC/YqgF family)
MNLELIEEINTLKDDDKTYTEIAEITGLARTSIVLSLRLSKIFNTSYSQQISSLNSDISLLKSTVEKQKNNILEKDMEIKRLYSLIDIDYDRNMLVKKDEFKNLEDELVKCRNEVDTLKRKLYYKDQYLKNLSFIDKMNILFS